MNANSDDWNGLNFPFEIDHMNIMKRNKGQNETNWQNITTRTDSVFENLT